MCRVGFFLLLVLLCGTGYSSATPPVDLDLDVPVGTPLDWDRDLPQPVPNITTGTPGRAAAKAPEPKTPEPKGAGTQIMAAPPVKPTPPPMVGFGIPNLYNFFRIKTVDIMQHLQVNIPKKPTVPFDPPAPKVEPPMIDTGTSTKERGKPEPAPAVQTRPGIKGDYVPQLPGELAWIAIATNIRAGIHPELVNFIEAKAYLFQIGEATLAYNNPGLIKGVPEIPNNPPPFPTMKDVIDRMASKIAVIELVSGYPNAMDPRYAKHTLLMGDVALNAIIECAKSPHTFLQHNAISVLSNAQGPRAADELRKILETSQDSISLVRAIMGLARKKDKKAIPLLLRRIQGGEEGVNAAAIYALGVIATEEVKVAQQLLSLSQSGSVDLAWTCLAAIARMRCAKDKGFTNQIAGLKNGWQQKSSGNAAAAAPPVPVPGAGGVRQAPVPEPAGTKMKIVAEIALLAAAASGDDASKREALGKGITGFNRQIWVLAAEVFPGLGPEGITAAKGVSSHEESNVAVAAIRAVGEFKEEVPWLKSVAGSGKSLLRAAALTRLIALDEEALKEVCRPIVASGSIGSAEDAFLTAMAAQMLDRIGANEGADVLNFVQRAKSANAIAKRTATDEYDVTKAKIEVFPACLEVATLCVGRTQHEPAVDVLIEMLNDTSGPVRGEAALSLGSFGMASQLKRVGEALLKGLVDPGDGWVRFCCYLSLKHLSGKDYPTDYVFGAMSDIWPSAVKYRDWLREQTKDLPAPPPEEKKPEEK